jgi:hypothetical protein
LDCFPKEDAIFDVRDHSHGLDLIHERVWFDVDGGPERIAFLLLRGGVSQDRGENRQRGETLLTIYDLADDLSGRLDKDDAAQKVRLAVARMHRLTEVLEQLQGMFRKPGVGTLVGWYFVDEGIAQNVSHGVLIGGNHLGPSPIFLDLNTTSSSLSILLNSSVVLMASVQKLSMLPQSCRIREGYRWMLH